MISTLLEVAKALLGVATTLKQHSEAQRRKLAQTFDRISSLLAEMVERRSIGKKFDDLCAELTVYADEIDEVADGLTSADRLRQVSEALRKAQGAREMLTMANNLTGFDQEIDTLLSISGTFRALGLITRPA